jgi:hypothetical protein
MCRSISFFGRSFVSILPWADGNIDLMLFQLHSSSRYQCSGSHGLVSRKSTYMYPLSLSLGSLFLVISVCLRYHR